VLFGGYSTIHTIYALCWLQPNVSSTYQPAYIVYNKVVFRTFSMHFNPSDVDGQFLYYNTPVLEYA